MLIPSAFWGDSRKVKSNYGKIATKLKNGLSIEDCLSEYNYIDSDNYPESLFWINRSWTSSAKEMHFRFCDFSNFLRDQVKLHNNLDEIVNNNIDYLSKTAWGTMIINSELDYLWIFNISGKRIREKGCHAVVRGFYENYSLLKAQKKDILVEHLQ